MTSFQVICGLGLPQSKILGTPMNWRSPEKKFLKTFSFGERLRLCPWPREVRSSKRLSLALASDFFCVLGLGLEPCVGIRLTPSVVIIFFLATLFFL